MKLYLLPYGGLANRMRAMDSAINMQKDGLCKVRIYWLQDKTMGCKFTDIFESLNFVTDLTSGNTYRFLVRILGSRFVLIRVFLRLLREARIFRYYRKEEIEAQYDFGASKDKRYLLVLMESWEYFYENENLNSDKLILKNNETLKELSSHINNNTIGVHIRRSDHKLAIQNSPLELFEEAMKKELDQEPQTNFLLCSDDEGVKDYFSKNSFWKDKIFTPHGDLTRDSVSGMQQAAGEMYALSKTRKILGSFWSSFSLMAAKIGGIQVDIIQKNE